MPEHNLDSWKIFDSLSDEVKQNIRLAIVFGGDAHNLGNAIFVTREDGVFCFGPNQQGCLGGGSTDPHPTPVKIEALSGKNVASLHFSGCSSRDDYSLFALCASGSVYAWGKNAHGELGLGCKDTVLTPTKITSDLRGKRVVQLACGIDHTLALTSDGQVFSFGSNERGILGLGDEKERCSPTKVEGPLAGRFVSAVACGYLISLALLDNGEVFSWGHDGDASYVPAVVTGLQGVAISKVACGPVHALAMSRDGRVFAWGFNFSGQVGAGMTGNGYVASPTLISANMGRVRDVVTFNSGFDLPTAAINDKGQVFIWGRCRGEAVLSPVFAQEFSALDEVYASVCVPAETVRALRPQTDSANSFTALLFDDRATCNFAFVLEGKRIFVHKLILIMRSPVFKAVFYGNYFNDLSVRELAVDGYKYEAFYAFLKYLHTDEIFLNEEIAIARLILELLALAQYYLMVRLERKCVSYLLSVLNKQNVASIYDQALKHNIAEFEELFFEFCMNNMRDYCSESLSNILAKNITQPDADTKRAIIREIFSSARRN